MERFCKQLENQHLIVLDELGYVPFSKTGAELLFEVVSRAYERTSLIDLLPNLDPVGMLGIRHQESASEVPPASSGQPVVPTRLPPAVSTARSTPAGNGVNHQITLLEIRAPDEGSRDIDQPS